MWKRLILVGCLVAALATPGFAEVVRLKNGKMVQGEIFEDHKNYIKIRVSGINYTYYRYEIDRITKTLEEMQQGQRDSSQVPLASKAKLDLVARLLEANGKREEMYTRYNELVSQYPPPTQKELNRYFNVDELIVSLGPVYAKYFTEDELKELIGFYSSPTGRKWGEMRQKLTEETAAQMLEYFKAKIPAEQAK